MASESQETYKEREIENENKEFVYETAICSPISSDAPKQSDSTSASYADCENLMRSPVQSTARHTDCDRMQQSGLPQKEGELSYKNLEDRYICIIDERKVKDGSEISEQPLDYSKKTISSDISNEFPQNIHRSPMNTHRFQENGANSVDGSCNEGLQGRDGFGSLENLSKAPKKAFQMKDSKNIILTKRREHMRIPEISLQCPKNESERNKLTIANFSKSEDESHPGYLVHKSSETVGERSQPVISQRYPLWPNTYPLPPSPSVSEKPPVPSSYSENGSNCSTEKKEKFQIQDILRRDNHSARLEEHSRTPIQIIESTTPSRISPPFDKEAVPPYSPISPYQSTNLQPLRLQVERNDQFQGSGVKFPSNIQTAFSAHHFGNPYPPRDAPGYSGYCLYSPETLTLPPFNPMHAYPFNQILHAGQKHQKLKNERPFKSIDTNTLLSHLPKSQSTAALGLDLPSSSAPCNSSSSHGSEVATASSSPQRRSPDSQSLVNGSFSNFNETVPRDVNGEATRKKIRRIPPEEKDAKYYEKRMKNNLAAKKSRNQRRVKEDILAESFLAAKKHIEQLTAENKILSQNLLMKERKYDMIVASLLSLREKCEGSAKEALEKTFEFLFPQQ